EQQGPDGPFEAIEIYKRILEEYPNYERNDQVLYQMSRAYEELGRPDEAMVVMNDFVRRHPHSRYVDEVQFRRGEYYFVRKKYLDAEEAYNAIISMGPASSYYELALYKMGWTLYKQELYEEALHRYIAMLDHRQANGFDFDGMSDVMAGEDELPVEQETMTEGPGNDQDRHRVEDTFRVISLSFSNLGGPEVVSEYFAVNGRRSYANLIYSNLAEFYFGKLRYADAASVYKSFIELNPFHEESPHFSMRIVEIYGAGGFPRLVVESKKEFATIYAMDAEYWHHFDVIEAPEVVGYLKTNLTDPANHYHALYQETAFVDDKPANFMEAQHWYREFLTSFPTHDETPGINYQLADLLLENKNFAEAAREYERTAYDYDVHEQAAAAGYAA
ncbi:MAG: tetratricopeptide repeat protein, partial [Pseudomonadales bacterium]|nr:tetratricopeptide repeat protein [Pseudomonadales bacterium]